MIAEPIIRWDNWILCLSFARLFSFDTVHPSLHLNGHSTRSKVNPESEKAVHLNSDAHLVPQYSGSNTSDKVYFALLQQTLKLILKRQLSVQKPQSTLQEGTWPLETDTVHIIKTKVVSVKMICIEIHSVCLCSAPLHLLQSILNTHKVTSWGTQTNTCSQDYLWTGKALQWTHAFHQKHTEIHVYTRSPAGKLVSFKMSAALIWAV